MEIANDTSPSLRLHDAGALAGSARRALFFAIATSEAERPSRRLAVAGREVVHAGETLDLGLVELRLVRSSHRH